MLERKRGAFQVEVAHHKQESFRIERGIRNVKAGKKEKKKERNVKARMFHLIGQPGNRDSPQATKRGTTQ